MRILLDTHVLLWLLADQPLLGPSGRALIREASEVHVSAVSIWEIAIKRSLGRIDIDAGSIAQAARASGLRSLPVTDAHAIAVESLPLQPADPFDRLLLAPARVEPLRLVTADAALEAYGEPVLRI
jgi:PIN domain nuclease of toxin-antitoxin system